MRKSHLLLILVLIILLCAGISQAMTKWELGISPPALTSAIRTFIRVAPLGDWESGGTAICSWDWGNLTGNVNVTLLKGSQVVATLSASCLIGENGKGSLTVKVPANLSPGTYELRVKSVAKPQIEDRRTVKIVKRKNP
jgi:hypothetical protein